MPVELVKPFLDFGFYANEHEGSNKHNNRVFTFFADIPLLDHTSFETYAEYSWQDDICSSDMSPEIKLPRKYVKVKKRVSCCMSCHMD
eukprot:11596248-Karenia_brevis.AAC.1